MRTRDKSDSESRKSINRHNVKASQHRSGRNREEEPDEEELEEVESEEFDYEADLDIDKFRLDLECSMHPQKYMKYARAAAQAQKRARSAEERVKTIRSELVNKAKQTDAGKNAATLEAYYRTDARYKKAKESWIDAQFQADLLTNAMFAMQGKKNMLESLVKLHGQEYFSTPTIDAEDAEKFNELKQNGARSKIRERMSR